MGYKMIIISLFLFLVELELSQSSPVQQIVVGKINSIHTQIPYTFFDMEICSIEDAKEIKDSIGEIFLGDTYYTSPFLAEKGDKFRRVCSGLLTKKKASFLKFLIDKEYTMSFFFDQIPLGLSKESDHKIISYKSGPKVGFKLNPEGLLDDNPKVKYCLNNYFNFSLSLNKESTFIEGSLYSQGVSDPEIEGSLVPCLNIDDLIDKKIAYFYDINFKDIDKQISTRWHFLIQSEEEIDIHWRPLILFLVIVVFVSAWIFIGFIRAVGRDIELYNIQIVSDSIIPIQKSWKQLSYDVFRAPVNRITFCAFVGTGIQIALILHTTLLLGFIGILSPEHRGYLLNSFFILAIIYNTFNGFFSASFYRLLGGDNWLINLITTSIVFPAFIGITIFFSYIGSRIDTSSVSK